MWNLQTISPSDLLGPFPNCTQIYNDEDDPFRYPPNSLSVPPIDIQNILQPRAHSTAAIATSNSNPPGPSSAAFITPLTPAHTLGSVSNVYHAFPSTPEHPHWHPLLLSPWHIPSDVRNLSFFLPTLAQTVPTISNHLRNQGLSFHSASTNEAPWCHRSDTSPTHPVTDVATLMTSTLSQVSTFICRSPTN